MKRPFGIQFLTTESTYLGSSHVPTFVLTCFLARVRVKSRFPRLCALVPLVAGFLHDNASSKMSKMLGSGGVGSVGGVVIEGGSITAASVSTAPVGSFV